MFTTSKWLKGKNHWFNIFDETSLADLNAITSFLVLLCLLLGWQGGLRSFSVYVPFRKNPVTCSCTIVVFVGGDEPRLLGCHLESSSFFFLIKKNNIIFKKMARNNLSSSNFSWIFFYYRIQRLQLSIFVNGNFNHIYAFHGIQSLSGLHPGSQWFWNHNVHVYI